jgi:uncharacterized membrane protein YsdA (DUF1294 family)/cold shock CspA family protein
MAKDIERIGTIVDWNDARGFGFIIGAGVRGRVFFHARDVAGSVRPKFGDEVAYELVAGRLGRPAARGVFLTGSRGTVAENVDEREDAPMRVTVRIVGALVIATAVVCCVVSGRAPNWLAACYVVGAAISFSAYWLDKQAARRRAWRTREETLHVLDLAFGIAGGLLAQGVLRHKSSKLSFAIMSAIIFALHMTALGLVLAGYDPVDWLSWVRS